MAVDKTITCRDCATQFVFSVREQEFFAEKGFGDPVRCVACRRALKAKRQGEGDNPQAGGPPRGEAGGFNRPQGDRPRRDWDPRDRGPRPDRAPQQPSGQSTNDSDQFPELRPNYRAEPAMAGGSSQWESGPRYRERSNFQESYPKKRKKLNSGRPRVEDDGSGWEE